VLSNTLCVVRILLATATTVKPRRKHVIMATITDAPMIAGPDAVDSGSPSVLQGPPLRSVGTTSSQTQRCEERRCMGRAADLRIVHNGVISSGGCIRWSGVTFHGTR
jgi:hypothetical protein